MGCRWWPLLLNRRTSRLIKTPWNVWKSRVAMSWPNSLKAFQTFKLALGVKTCCHRLLLAVAHWCGCRTSKWLMTIAVKSEAKAVWKTLRSVCCSTLGITVLSCVITSIIQYQYFVLPESRDHQSQKFRSIFYFDFIWINIQVDWRISSKKHWSRVSLIPGKSIQLFLLNPGMILFFPDDRWDHVRVPI